MKTRIKEILMGGLALLATGCTDLDVPVDSQYTSYPNNEIAIEAQMTSIYNQMRDCFGRRYMEAMALSSDEWTAVSYSGGWIDSHAYANPSFHAYTYETATIDWMEVPGIGVVKANEIISSEAPDNVKASARAMRAFFTFIMMDCWGDVPINDPSLADQIDLEERQPRADVARWLESELKEIIPALPTDDLWGTNYGKPTKYMAQALLAKIYINWAVYTADAVENYDAASAKNEKLADCIAVCDEIIQSGKFSLGSMAYRFKFASNNTDLKVEDFIYVMPYHTTEATGMQYGRSHSYKDIKNCKPSYYGMNLSNSGGGYMTMTPECASRFNLPGDERNNCVIGGTVHVYDPNTLLPTDQICKDKAGDDLVLTKEINLVDGANDYDLNVGDNRDGYRQGYRSIKWFVIDDDFKNGRNQSNDLPIFRYADILLIKAEALTRQGGANSTARDLFNQIRSYVKAPTLDHNPTLDEIYDERGREFFDENWRRNDMIRFGHFEDEFFPHYKSNPNANFDKTRRIFPISKDDLDLNPKWKQNNGY